MLNDFVNADVSGADEIVNKTMHSPPQSQMPSNSLMYALQGGSDARKTAMNSYEDEHRLGDKMKSTDSAVIANLLGSGGSFKLTGMESIARMDSFSALMGKSSSFRGAPSLQKQTSAAMLPNNLGRPLGLSLTSPNENFMQLAPSLTEEADDQPTFKDFMMGKE